MPFLASNSSWGPNSATLPSSMTRSRSAIAQGRESRWAMAMVVRPLYEPRQGLLDEFLRFGIHRGCRLIEDEDLRIVKDGPGDGDPLNLTPRKARAALADARVVAVWESHDESVARWRR